MSYVDVIVQDAAPIYTEIITLEDITTTVTVEQVQLYTDVVIQSYGITGAAGPQGAPGAAGEAENIIFGETPSGFINGVNDVFTTANLINNGKIAVYLNGLRVESSYYLLNGQNQFVLDDAPLTNDKVTVDYLKQ